jgi:hypothetical protein
MRALTIKLHDLNLAIPSAVRFGLAIQYPPGGALPTSKSKAPGVQGNAATHISGLIP